MNAENSCVATATAIPNCFAASHVTLACVACNSGYYPRDGVCHLCSAISGCSTCSSMTASCNACSSGYYKGSSLACFTCQTISGCSTNSCSNTNSSCTQCSTGYKLSAGRCTKITCPSGSYVWGNQCCSNTYTVVNTRGKCLAHVSNCTRITVSQCLAQAGTWCKGLFGNITRCTSGACISYNYHNVTRTSQSCWQP